MKGNKKLNCVLLHGWGVTNNVWKSFDLKLNDFENVYTPCLYDIYRHSNDQGFEAAAKALSKKIKKNNIVIAWSIGGLIALRLMALTTKVRAIIFIASSPCFINKEGWPNVINKNSLSELKKRFSSDAAEGLKHFAGLVAYGDMSSSVTNKTIRQYLAAEKQSQILSSWLSELEKTDQRDQFAALEIPVQIILGQNDILIKSNIQNQIRQLNPYTHSSIIKNCGHAPFISRPDETYNVINKFLNERI